MLKNPFNVINLKVGQIKSFNFDIISCDLVQDGRAAVRGFRILREQDFFRAIEKPYYVIWSDCGKHFRNSEFIGYVLGELADEGIHGIFIF